MDREISDTIVKKRKFKFLFVGLIIACTFLLSIYGLRMGLETKVDSNRIRTAVVEEGPIENTITTSGEILPVFEQVISSSIKTSILEVLKPVGSEVDRGTRILLLDKSLSLFEYEQLLQELELNKNGLEKLKLELNKNLFDLQIADSTKFLKINQLKAELKNAERLQNVGGGTKEAIDLASLNLRIAQLEKRQLEHDLSIQQRQTETSIKELEIKSIIHSSELRKMKQKLDRAEVIAKRKGVLTWVNENLGTTVDEGDILARIADLKSFKVLGSCSDLYVNRINIGMQVVVQLNDNDKIYGKISNIHPTIENNIVTFDVLLDDPNHEALRPNMKVELFIITNQKSKVIRVVNGPAFKGTPEQFVFVLEEGQALRRKVKVGLSNFDYVEIISGLNKDEEIVISDMTQYHHLPQVKID